MDMFKRAAAFRDFQIVFKMMILKTGDTVTYEDLDAARRGMDNICMKLMEVDFDADVMGKWNQRKEQLKKDIDSIYNILNKRPPGYSTSRVYIV